MYQLLWPKEKSINVQNMGNHKEVPLKLHANLLRGAAFG